MPSEPFKDPNSGARAARRRAPRPSCPASSLPRAGRRRAPFAHAPLPSLDDGAPDQRRPEDRSESVVPAVRPAGIEAPCRARRRGARSLGDLVRVGRSSQGSQLARQVRCHGGVEHAVLRHSARAKRSELDAPRHRCTPVKYRLLVEDVISDRAVTAKAVAIQGAQQAAIFQGIHLSARPGRVDGRRKGTRDLIAELGARRVPVSASARPRAGRNLRRQRRRSGRGYGGSARR